MGIAFDENTKKFIGLVADDEDYPLDYTFTLKCNTFDELVKDVEYWKDLLEK